MNGEKAKKKFKIFDCIIILVIAAIIVFIVADDPVTALRKFLLGPLTTKRNFFNVVETMIPLVFCGLAINVMHKSGLFSMVADSSFYFAGVTAAVIYAFALLVLPVFTMDEMKYVPYGQKLCLIKSKFRIKALDDEVLK